MDDMDRSPILDSISTLVAKNHDLQDSESLKCYLFYFIHKRKIFSSYAENLGFLRILNQKYRQVQPSFVFLVWFKYLKFFIIFGGF